MTVGTSHGFGLFSYQSESLGLAKCTLHTNDSLVMEGPLSRMESLKQSLHQSFPFTCKSRVLGKKRDANAKLKVQDANVQPAEQAYPWDMEIMPMQLCTDPAWPTAPSQASSCAIRVSLTCSFETWFIRDPPCSTNSGSTVCLHCGGEGGEKRLEWLEE